jgi:hypothetical protein
MGEVEVCSVIGLHARVKVSIPVVLVLVSYMLEERFLRLTDPKGFMKRG